MKTLYAFIVLSLFLSLASCNDDNGNGDDNIPEGEFVKIKIKPNDLNRISFTVWAESVTIEWGDGKRDTYTSAGGQEEILLSHKYENDAIRSIALSAESLREFLVSAYSWKGELLELTFFNCDELETVVASPASLDVSRATSLKFLNICEGDYSKSQVDAILSKLPDWLGDKDAAPVVSIRFKQEYTASIATEKGWVVKEFLVIEPKDHIEEELLFSHKGGFQDALTECYLLASNFFIEFYMFEGLYSHTIDINDIQNPSQYLKDFYNRNLTSSLVKNRVKNMWDKADEMIAGCNTILKYYEREEEFRKYGYTARALRAFMYYQMINLWGDVPYMEKAAKNVAPSSAKDIADKLIIDLNYLETVAPAKQPDGFQLLFTPDAIKALLAKIYLWRGDKTKALQCAKQLISGNKYSLYSKYDYAKIFQEFAGNTEKITPFVIQIPRMEHVPYHTLIKNREDIMFYYIPSVRYAEILLIAAEASTSDSEKIGYINQLRSRNERTLLTAASTATDIANALIEEYRFDLVNEGLYLFTLKRLGRTEDVLGITLPLNFFSIPE